MSSIANRVSDNQHCVFSFGEFIPWSYCWVVSANAGANAVSTDDLLPAFPWRSILIRTRCQR